MRRNAPLSLPANRCMSANEWTSNRIAGPVTRPFVLGDPTSPVWRGEIQAAGLGMAVDVWNDDGRPVRQEKGSHGWNKEDRHGPVQRSRNAGCQEYIHGSRVPH